MRKGRQAKGETSGARRHPNKIAEGVRKWAKDYPERIARGERRSKNLTDDKVREIRRRLANGESQTNLAAEFGVSKITIFDIHHGKTWRHLL